MSRESALNFDQGKTSSENFKPIGVCLWLVYRIVKDQGVIALQLFTKLIQTKKRYPTLTGYFHSKTTSHTKQNILLGIKLLKN